MPSKPTKKVQWAKELCGQYCGSYYTKAADVYWYCACFGGIYRERYGKLERITVSEILPAALQRPILRQQLRHLVRVQVDG